MLLQSEEKDLRAYLDYSMNIGRLPDFVERKRIAYKTLYRGIKCHKKHLTVGKEFIHFEPLMSCTTSFSVAEDFALFSCVPEDIIEEEAKFLGFKDNGTDEDYKKWNDALDLFKPVVIHFTDVFGIRVLDYIQDYGYKEENEVIVKTTPLLVQEVLERKNSKGEKYTLLKVIVADNPYLTGT